MGVVTGGGASGIPSIFARVSLSAPIAGWDGTTLPFDTIDYDPAGLWDTTNHWFAAKAAGWYEVAAYPTIASTSVTITAVASTGAASVIAVIGGLGNNINTEIRYHTEVTSGVWAFPPLFGHTQLGVGDTVDFEGDGSGGGANVPAGFAMSLRMIAQA